MQQILDLHIHSKYSRACSRDLTLSNIDKTCRTKGVDIIATGDFTYPAWFKDIKDELEPSSGKGLYRLKGSDDKIKFILSTELALIYKSADKCRRIHIVLHAPNIEAIQELNDFLDKKFNIRSDGRPILGMSAPNLVKLCLEIHPKFLIYPAHIWTPWFSVFGSKSGFDKLEECFEDQTENIYAYETGLSSDPEMNWRVSALDKLTLLSNSDAHSLPNIAREANVFEMNKVNYDEVYDIIRNKIVYSGDEKKITHPNPSLKKRRGDTGVKYTIEFYPEEGMYHFDGHRTCGISLEPEKTKKNKGICPVCKKPLTVGVLNRVEELADRSVGYKSDTFPHYKKLVELDKIIAESINIKSRSSSKVQILYQSLIKDLGSELKILLDTPIEKIERSGGNRLANAIDKVRKGELIIKPGYDGQYGEVKIFNENEDFNAQKTLF